MSGGKLQRIIFIHQLLFLCSMLRTVKCQKTTFSDFSYSAKNYEVKKDNSVGAGSKTDLKTNCTINISEHSKYNFSSMILRYKYNFVYLELEFNNFSVVESDDVIQFKSWVWTYKGDEGGYQNLFLPSNYGYLSFGLLWTHTFVGPMPLKLSITGVCNNLTSGNTTDVMIGEALGNMTNDIATRHDKYNSSHWCHYVRIKIKGIIWYLCENIDCPYQTFEYRCCKYNIDYVNKTRNIDCNHEHYHLGTVWWNLAFYLGFICWIYYTLLLTYIGCKLSNTINPIQTMSLEMDNVLNSPTERIEEEFVFSYKGSYPITFLGTLKQAMCFCNVENTLFSRLLRFIIIVLPLAVLVFQVLIEFIYNGKLIKAAISKGALQNFNTLLVDFQSAKKGFLTFFGGPHVALSLFVLLSCIFIQLPRDLESFLARGLFNFESLGSSPLTLSLQTKCHLAGLQCSDMTGFDKLHYTLYSNLLLLLNTRFWKHTFKILFYRWKLIIYPFLKNNFSTGLLAAICIPLVVVYVIICIFELAIMLLLYLFPIVNFLLILSKAYVNSITDFCKFHSNTFVKAICYLLVPFTILALSYAWYIYCLVLFHCIWFFLCIILYTYSGIIAYPRISYGYLILVFMTIYYMVEIVNKFGKSYQKLLHITIKVCKSVNHISRDKTVEIENDKGVPKKLWELIIEKHQARRIKMASTVLQLAVLISILYVSVDLLERFNQFQELSVITHVFTVLAICALPKIIKSVYIDKMCGQNKHKLAKDINNTVLDYLEDNIEEHVHIYHLLNYNEYEEI